MSQRLTTIDADKFMDALLLLKTSDGQKFQRQDDDDHNATVIDWALFGRYSAHLYRTAPSTSFMYVLMSVALCVLCGTVIHLAVLRVVITRCGPLQFEPAAKKPKLARAAKEKDEAGPGTQADIVDPSKEEKTQTDQRVKAVKKELATFKKAHDADSSFFDFTVCVLSAAG